MATDMSPEQRIDAALDSVLRAAGSRLAQARPHSELIAEMLDSRIPKTEREHAAAREIERLRGLCDDLYSDLLKLTDTTDKRVLDPCCGSRMMWFDRAHPDVVFGDKRSETITVTDRSHGNASGQRVLRVEPDVTLDFRALPYADGTFNLVAFDPPHLVRAGPKSWLAAKYGKLGEDWRDDLRRGFAECFRVLATDGVLVFKWNETQVKVTEVLALTPVAPLFGHPTGRKGLTHWLVFMRPNT